MVPSDSGRDPFDFGRDPITSDFGRFRPISKRLRQISDGSVLFWRIHSILDGSLLVRKRDFFLSLFAYSSLLLIGKFPAT